jgi:hypothetical protein
MSSRQKSSLLSQRYEQPGFYVACRDRRLRLAVSLSIRWTFLSHFLFSLAHSLTTTTTKLRVHFPSTIHLLYISFFSFISIYLQGLQVDLFCVWFPFFFFIFWLASRIDFFFQSSGYILRVCARHVIHVGDVAQRLPWMGGFQFSRLFTTCQHRYRSRGLYTQRENPDPVLYSVRESI